MRPVVLSGCSGGGKSTLIDSLGANGHMTVPEPGRRAVREGLSWQDEPRRFAERLVAMAVEDIARVATAPGRVFFDRGLIDAALALAHVGGPPATATLAGKGFDPVVFMVPPQPELYRTDDARRHGLDEAVDEYRRLMAAYPALGYEPVPLPRAPVAERMATIFATLERPIDAR